VSTFAARHPDNEPTSSARRGRSLRGRGAAWLSAFLAACIGFTLLPGLSATAASTARIDRWVDGDTVVLKSGARIRLIGVDTPERGECGYWAAKRLANRLAPPGTIVRIGNPTSVRNRDAHGRLLRYVNAGTTDVGLAQIRHGARARYDSRDGHDYHPRQRTYRHADATHASSCASDGGDTTSYSPVPGTWDCPSNAPIKGNDKSDDSSWNEPYKGIYHLPSQAYYDSTNPEECFASEAGAINAGYRKAGA